MEHKVTIIFIRKIGFTLLHRRLLRLLYEGACPKPFFGSQVSGQERKQAVRRVEQTHFGPYTDVCSKVQHVLTGGVLQGSRLALPGRPAAVAPRTIAS